jgi:hypothetical protein
VGVNVEISLGAHCEVEQAVLSELAKHMIEKPDPRGNIRNSGTINIDRNLNVGFFSLAVDRTRTAAIHSPLPACILSRLYHRPGVATFNGLIKPRSDKAAAVQRQEPHPGQRANHAQVDCRATGQAIHAAMPRSKHSRVTFPG